MLFRDGNVSFLNDNGDQVVYIGDDSGDHGHVRFFNKNKRIVAYVGSSTKGAGLIVLGRDSSKHRKLTINESNITIYNKRGKEVVYLGTTTTQNGMLEINGNRVRDYAETFELVHREDIMPGTVMSASIKGVGLESSTTPYDKRVVGVVSGAGGFNPGMVIGTRRDGTNDLPVALSGQVYVRVCVENGSIKTGDLLVSSSIPGVAMRGTDRQQAFGAVIGKALEPYHNESGKSEGLIRMLVMNR